MATIAEPGLSSALRAIWFLDTLTFIKVAGVETRGAYSICEQILPPGHETPYHLHRNEDEGFYVLEGELTLVQDGRCRLVRAGEFVFAPRNVPHGLRVAGGERVRTLIVANPAGFEEFICEMGAPARSMTYPPRVPPDLEKLVHLAAKYGIEILGPLPA